MPNCAYCRIHACDRKAAQQMPPNCPSHDITDQTLMEYLTEIAILGAKHPLYP